MVYFGYQQSKGGYAYYFSGKRGSAHTSNEKDTDTPDVPVDKDNIPTVEKDENVVVEVHTKPTTEKVKMEDEATDEGVNGTDGKDKVGQIETD